ncbi:hypothetical protein MOBT1_002049 [Malassezia obtusa]|uniref:Centromere protein H C-terminal domain-containing protein n=1 Tax=Malassezia obtusa TaxID=76774 RepID=A0AAF0E195_9BASI|nr:hypothetical protein MOBT1_002049 [Malassezia obtusa]
MSAELDRKKAQLHALEQACAVRRAILASYVVSSRSVESSFEVTSALQASEPRKSVEHEPAEFSSDVRALLRERDDLAFDILQTQRALEEKQEESVAFESEIQRTRQQAVHALHEAREAHKEPPPDAAKMQRDLLHGVILGLAMHGDIPWYEDPELTELVLSMDAP